jgi:hypothetical protein
MHGRRLDGDAAASKLPQHVIREVHDRHCHFPADDRRFEQAGIVTEGAAFGIGTHRGVQGGFRRKLPPQFNA